MNPDLQLQGSCSDRPHRTRRSSLSGLQTVAECVLYYYLTKKNENYKSLVRRSYRRRGKSQVRDGAGRLALGARPPRAVRPFAAWVVTIHPQMWFRGRLPWFGLLSGGWETLSGGDQPTLAAEGSTSRKTTSILSLESSRTPGSVNHDPCSKRVTSPVQGLRSLGDLGWLTSLTFKKISVVCLCCFYAYLKTKNSQCSRLQSVSHHCLGGNGGMRAWQALAPRPGPAHPFFCE